MRILAFTDLHGNKKMLEDLEKTVRTENPDIIICAGDFTNFERKMEEILFDINMLGKPVLLIHGNHEDSENVQDIVQLFDYIKFIHKKPFKIGKYEILGFGGGGFSQTDKEFEKYSKKIGTKKNLILVTHAPPYGTKLDFLHNAHRGNRSFSNFIRKTQPLLAISGHLHETSGVQDKIGKTVLINPGARGVIIEVWDWWKQIYSFD